MNSQQAGRGFVAGRRVRSTAALVRHAMFLRLVLVSIVPGAWPNPALQAAFSFSILSAIFRHRRRGRTIMEVGLAYLSIGRASTALPTRMQCYG